MYAALLGTFVFNFCLMFDSIYTLPRSISCSAFSYAIIATQ